MKYEQHVKDIYKIAGMLEALSLIPGQTITVTPGLAADLEDAVDKLELIGAEMANEGYEIKIDSKPNIRMVDFFDDEHMRLLHNKRPMKKVVKVHEGSEESPHEPQPADQ